MPPKRKAVSNTAEGSPTKRHTRSSGPVLADTQPASTTLADRSSATKRKAPIKTYGRAQRNSVATDNSLKENEIKGRVVKGGEEASGAGDEESSEDELNLTPSSISPKKVTQNSLPLEVVVRTTGNPTEAEPSRDVETPTRKRGRPTKFNSQSAISSKILSFPDEGRSEEDSDEPISSALLRKVQASRESARPATRSHPIDSQDALRSTRNAKVRTSQVHIEDGIAQIEGSTSTSIQDTCRTTRSSPAKSPAKSSSIRRTSKRGQPEQIDEPNALPATPGKRSKRLNKRELENDSEGPSPGPSPKKLRIEISNEHQTDQSPSPPPVLTVESMSDSLPKRDTISSPPSRISPSKRSTVAPSLPTRIPEALPFHLHSCFNAQKTSLLRFLQRPLDPHPDSDEEADGDTEPETSEIAFQQLEKLLIGTVNRGEGNSCLLLGPRGSGKTRLVERCISNLPDKPIILRLSGWIQHSDRLAMREIAYQLGQQTGTSFLASPDDVPEGMDDEGANDDESNPFLDKPTTSTSISGPSLPPSSHLPALISILPTLPRSTVVILDGFDLFSLHPRQSLLYCLLDTAQSCRASAGSKGLAVIGITSRIDTINLLEKRVKSRFSGRILRTAPPRKLEDWVKLAKATLTSDITDIHEDKDHNEEWRLIWDMAMDRFFSDKAVSNTLNETFSITRDVRMLSRMLISLTLQLTPASPFPSVSQFASTALSQRTRPRFPFLHTLSYPTMCLLIASVHADTAGHAIFTFEMLHEYFRDQVRASSSAPVQVNGGSIGMVRCNREVLMSAFEHLATMKIFTCVAPASSNVAKEFVKYRSVAEREDVKKAIDKTGQINLKKWFTKAQ